MVRHTQVDWATFHQFHHHKVTMVAALQQEAVNFAAVAAVAQELLAEMDQEIKAEMVEQGQPQHLLAQV
jgi:hypothetical protein